LSSNPDWSRGLASACSRLVHPAVADEAEKGFHGRLIGVLLMTPFPAAAAAAQVLPAQASIAVVLATVCGLFGLSWLGALAAAATGRASLTGLVMLPAAAAGGGVLVHMAGGLASPLTLLLGALVFEPFWIARSVRAMRLGILAAMAAIGGAILLDILVGPTGAAASAWHWIVPAAYAASLWLRLRPEGGSVGAAAQSAAQPAAIEGLALRLTRTGEVVDVGGDATDLLGVEADLLLGQGLFERLHVADRVAYLCALAALRDGAAGQRLELRLRLPGREGSRFAPFVMVMKPVESGTGEIAVLLRDNSELVELRSALEAARRDAQGIEIAKGRFLAAVSHELRTPLNAIIGFSDMLLQEVFGSFADPRQKDYVGLVKQSGSHLLDVVNSILDVSKIEAGAYAIRPESFSFRKAVDMCLAMISLQAEVKGVRLVDMVPGSVGEIVADQRAVQQILINLVSNAVKFTPAGGTVTLGASRFGSRLTLWVEDTGIGMSEEDLGRIGRPFTQVDNEYTRHYEGTGLGLSLVKGLVDLHEGGMSIASAPGQGTLVSIDLPVDGPAGLAAPDAMSALPKRPQGELIDGPFRKTA
jgi:cell cycle sensor histidine kinase DivJ